MNYSKLTIIGAIVCSGLIAQAAEVANLTAGKLAQSGVTPDETSLSITGQMNAADFSYIFNNLNALESLNLWGVSIVAYNGEALPYTGVKNSPANTLPDYALVGMTKLKNISLPAKLEAIGTGALSGTGITNLLIPESVTTIGDYAAMRCEQLSSITIPVSVKAIGTRAFAYCPRLKSVDMSASITTIPEGLFEACGGLTQLSLSGLTSCKEIGPWAVAECNGLSTLILPYTSEAIERGALYSTNQINSLVLPNALDYIGDNAMSAMTSLKEIDASKVDYVPELGNNVWSRLDQNSITLITPNNQVEDYKSANQWKNFNIVSQSQWESSTETITSTGPDKDKMHVAVNDDQIIVTAETDLGQTAVFNAAGLRIVSTRAKQNANISIRGWAPGVYLVVSELGATKVNIK